MNDKNVDTNIKKKFVDIINEKLMIKRNENDNIVSLNLPEHKFKKYSEKLNWAMYEVYKEYSNKEGVLLYHILLSLQDYFDVVWLYNNILSNDLKNIIKKELKNEHDIKTKNI